MSSGGFCHYCRQYDCCCPDNENNAGVDFHKLREVVERLLSYEDADRLPDGTLPPIDRNTLGWTIFTDDCREAVGQKPLRRKAQ
jgi:hypothetical protein